MSQHYTPLLVSPSLLRAQQEFSFALLRQVAQGRPAANVFLSPLSVGMALLLALEGSAGATQAVIADTLCFGEVPPA